jgi:hypothetical protein
MKMRTVLSVEVLDKDELLQHQGTHLVDRIEVAPVAPDLDAGTAEGAKTCAPTTKINT